MASNPDRSLGLPQVKRPDMPATVSYTPVNPINPIYESLFGEAGGTEPDGSARSALEGSFQDWLDARRNTLEQQRTDDVRLARFNALGNALTTLAQPIGWAASGLGQATGGTQPYDNRQYLDAFNRAVRAGDDLRNLGNAEAEFRFKLDEDDYRRRRALEDEALKAEQNLAVYRAKSDADIEKQRQIYDMREQLSQSQIEGRIAVAEAAARAKYRFSTNKGGKVAESVRDNLLKRANTAYSNILADYYKKRQVGIENLQEPPTYDEFLKRFASENGYDLSGTDGSQTAETKPSASDTAKTGQAASSASGGRKPNPMGGAASSKPASGKKPNPMK